MLIVAVERYDAKRPLMPVTGVGLVAAFTSRGYYLGAGVPETARETARETALEAAQHLSPKRTANMAAQR